MFHFSNYNLIYYKKNFKQAKIAICKNNHPDEIKITISQFACGNILM